MVISPLLWTLMPAAPVRLPPRRVMRTPYCIRREIGHCLKQGSKLQEPLHLVHGSERYRLRFDCRACEMYLTKERS